MELESVSREHRLAIIAAQASELATLRARIAELERAVARAASPARRPKVQASVAPGATPKPARKRRAHGYGRARSQMPTRRVRHVLARCPACGEPLTGGWVHRRREVLDVPVGTAPAQVTAHEVIARVCPRCRQRR